MSDHHAIGLNATDWRIGAGYRTWEWLRRAMRDVGISLAGHSWHSTSMVNSKRYDYRFGVVGDPGKVALQIQELWDNERPGCGLDIDIIY